jgi:hypothetical protein
MNIFPLRAMEIAHKWSIQGLPVDWWGEAFEGEEELAAVFAFEEIEVALAAVLLGEGDAGGGFGGGRNMSGAVGPGLYDMHHAASACRVTTDIERICSHQNATHRRYSRIKIYFRHRASFFDAVVGFDGFGLDDDGRVTALEVLRGRGYGTRHVTGGEGETRRDKDAE